MQLTVARKLGLSFAIVISLTAVSALVAYLALGVLDESVRAAVERSGPSSLKCVALSSELNYDVALLRGFLLLGDDPKYAEYFKTTRAQAWRRIEGTLADLRELSANWEREADVQRLQQVATLLTELRPHEQEIESIAQTQRNNRARDLYLTDAAGHAEQMQAALAALVESARERQQPAAALESMNASLIGALGALRQFLLDGAADTRQAFEAQWRAFRDELRDAEKEALAASHQDEGSWRRLGAAYSEFEPYPARLLALRASPDWNVALSRIENDSIPVTRRARDLLGELGESMTEQVRSHRGVISANVATVTWTLIGGASAAVLIATTIAVGLSRRMVTRLQSIAGAARRLAAGDLSGDDLPGGSRDELNDLVNAFNGMRAKLRDMTAQIRQATENVNSTAAEILASTQQQAAAAKEQAATIQEITSTMEEIDQSGNQIGDRAKQVSETILEASTVTQRGMKATSETSQTMEAIRDQVEEVAENVVNLSERTQAIGEIIATVSEIAEQSNLLALNASIEAVSAGDQGGRFGIVAHEMKNLADRAKDCTVQVRTILSEIQKGINTSVMLTEEAVKRSDAGKQQSHATETTIREVTETNQESIQAFQQIVAGANQQQIGVRQVTQGMQDIRQAIKQTAASTNQLEKAAANMNALSQQLHRLVAQYQL